MNCFLCQPGGDIELFAIHCLCTYILYQYTNSWNFFFVCVICSLYTFGQTSHCVKHHHGFILTFLITSFTLIAYHTFLPVLVFDAFILVLKYIKLSIVQIKTNKQDDATTSSETLTDSEIAKISEGLTESEIARIDRRTREMYHKYIRVYKKSSM